MVELSPANLELGLELPLSKPSMGFQKLLVARHDSKMQVGPSGQVAEASATPTCPSSCSTPEHFLL